MYLNYILSIVVIVITIHEQEITASFWPCKPCASQEECDAEPNEYCIWGENRDMCDRRVCSKGPGEKCGGPRKILGVCGEGMVCKADEKCHGCSILTMQCYTS